MPARKITELDELAESPAGDDMLAIVDVSDTTMAPTGTTKRIAAAALTAPTPTYPTFVWNQYGYYDEGGNWVAPDPITLAGGSWTILPLDTSITNAMVENPAGWTADAGYVYLPDGLYAISWYWEQESNGQFFDNYVDVRVNAATYIYPTAPMAHPNSYWGFGSATIRTGDDAAYVDFSISNRDSEPHNIRNVITITRLDA